MGRKNMAAKKTRVRAHLGQKFSFEITLNGHLNKFCTWISLHLPKEALNALRDLQSERTFETPCTIERPLAAASLQRPLFFPQRTNNPYIESCLTPLYNGHLFSTATFFGPQGGHCREV